MSTMNGYPLGAPCWVELATTDVAAARAFWRALMAWTLVDVAQPDGGTYTRFQLDGRDVGGCHRMDAAQRAHGTAPHWNVHFAVEDIDARCAIAEAEGGRVLAGPFEVGTLGRAAVLIDPEGAGFRLWQPRSHPGAGAVHEDRAVGWIELASHDTAIAAAFYSRLLGWTLRERPHPVAGTYRTWAVNRYDWGGMLPIGANPGNTAAHWAVYWRVGDCTVAAARVAELGGKILSGPVDTPGMGRIVSMQDPTGVRCHLIRFGGAA
ncbi:MAG TPA: VOC family protein [Pseudomonadota bacterium]|nr:VOC family protein [Xanthomonadales bacterium]HQX23553.1 VOC family protein [Pseudomonadota bacterium]HRA36098.1 VOC family protein [Pseudomonadota bacterium]